MFAAPPQTLIDFFAAGKGVRRLPAAFEVSIQLTMRFRLHAFPLGATLCLLLQTPAAAQTEAAPTRFAIGPYFLLAVPGGAVNERWGVGAGLGVQASARVGQQYAIYAGYSGTRFDLDIIDDMHAIDHGLAAGMMRSFPKGGGGVSVPWVRAGMLAHRLYVVRRGDAGEESGPADGRVGFEAGAGIDVHSSRGVQATLGLEFRRYRARVLGPEREVVSYRALRGGLIFAF